MGFGVFLCMIYWDGLMRTKTSLMLAFAELPCNKTTSLSPQVKMKMTSNSRQFFSVCFFCSRCTTISLLWASLKRRFPTAGTSPQNQGPFQELDTFPSQEPVSKFSCKVSLLQFVHVCPFFSLLNIVIVTKYRSVWWIELKMLTAKTG